MYQSHIDLSAHVRKGVIALLQARLSDALDLEAQMKQAHWNVKGRDFFQLHELFGTGDGLVSVEPRFAQRRLGLGSDHALQASRSNK